MGARTLLVLVVLLAVSCDAGSGFPVAPREESAMPDLVVTAFEQQSLSEVRRDQALLLHFSAPLDPDSVRPGSIRVERRRDGADQPVTLSVTGDTVRLTPPSPFGLDGRTRYRVVVEGFPSLRAPRSLNGRPTARRFTYNFTTSAFYGPDLTPPRVDHVRVEEDPAGFWSVVIAFTEPVDPESMMPGESVHLLGSPGDQVICGRFIHGRHAKVYRFLPEHADRPAELSVLLTTAIVDFAGNALRLDGFEEVHLSLSDSPLDSVFGEVVEDFTSTAMLDRIHTTALWNSPRAPGVLLGGPAATDLPLRSWAEPVEDGIPIGPAELEVRLLLRPEDLGPARELTGLAWSPAAGAAVFAEYEDLSVSITPTLREGLDEQGFDLGPAQVVVERRRYRVKGETKGEIVIPFTRFFAYDGESSLLVDLRIGLGSHQNLLAAQAAEEGVAIAELDGLPTASVPALRLRSFTMEPVATSRFYDSGSENPTYFAPLLSPPSPLRDARVTLEFQGAHAIEPFLTASEWVDDVTLLAGFRYVRFRASFRGVSLSEEDRVLDDLRIPYLR